MYLCAELGGILFTESSSRVTKFSFLELASFSPLLAASSLFLQIAQTLKIIPLHTERARQRDSLKSPQLTSEIIPHTPNPKP